MATACPAVASMRTTAPRQAPTTRCGGRSAYRTTTKRSRGYAAPTLDTLGRPHAPVSLGGRAIGLVPRQLQPHPVPMAIHCQAVCCRGRWWHWDRPLAGMGTGLERYGTLSGHDRGVLAQVAGRRGCSVSDLTLLEVRLRVRLSLATAFPQ